jgi:hypothetical protein
MKVWPRTSTNDEAVCVATCEAIVLASSPFKPVFKILTLTILFLSNCFSISFSTSCEAPSFPIHTVGFASLKVRLTKRFFPAVNLLILGFLLFLLSKRYSHLSAAAQARNHYVRLSALLDSHTTIHTRQDKLFTMSANLTPVFLRQSNLCCHSDFSSQPYIALCQSRVFINCFTCQTKKGANTLHGYVSSFRVHLLVQYSDERIMRVFNEISLSTSIAMIINIKFLTPFKPALVSKLNFGDSP